MWIWLFFDVLCFHVLLVISSEVTSPVRVGIKNVHWGIAGWFGLLRRRGLEDQFAPEFQLAKDNKRSNWEDLLYDLNKASFKNLNVDLVYSRPKWFLLPACSTESSRLCQVLSEISKRSRMRNGPKVAD
jgi:hypothetical protein